MGWLNNTPEAGETSDSSGSDVLSPSGDGRTAAADVIDLNDNADDRQLLLSKLSAAEDQHAAALAQSQNRIAGAERRIRERDAQATALREEKASCLRQIDDLKNQLYQLQFEVEETTSDKAEQAAIHRTDLAEGRRRLDESKRALDEALRRRSEAVAESAALDAERRTLEERRAVEEREREEEVAALTARVAEGTAERAKVEQLHEKEASKLRGLLRARDDVVRGLQGRVEEGQGRMTELEAELDELREKERRSREEAEHGERSRREEEERRDDEKLDKLLHENEQLNRIVEEQGRELEDLIAVRRQNEELNEALASQERAMKEMEDRRADREEKEEHNRKEEAQRSLAEQRREEEILLLREECEGQRALAEERGEEIDLMKSILQQGESEKEATVARQNSSHSRATVLEMELQRTNEKVDELSSALNESMEEIEDLQADVVFKEGRISSLEKEIEEASSLLEVRGDDDNDDEDGGPVPSSSSEGGDDGEQRGGGSHRFARLRQEIEKTTRETARMETEHSLAVERLAASKDREIADLERALDEASRALGERAEEAASAARRLAEAEAKGAVASAELAKTREVMDAIDAEEDRELEEMRERADALQASEDKLRYEVKELRLELEQKERELAEKDAQAQEELREARAALITMDEEKRRFPLVKEEQENALSEGEARDLNERLSACEARARESQTKLAQTTQEKDAIISDLTTELRSKEEYAGELRDELESTRLSAERAAPPSKRNYGMAIDPEWHEADELSRLKAQASRVARERKMLEKETRAKIESRDATIATLVLLSSNQEASVAELTSEAARLRAMLAEATSSSSSSSGEKDVEASRRREVEGLRKRDRDLTFALERAESKLKKATGELEMARSQLRTAEAMPDVQDLAGRLVVSEQAQRMLKAEGAERLRERDAAIAGLLRTVQGNEAATEDLRSEADKLQRKLDRSAEENRRLQRESEIFAAQIIDQDEEFESLNARLKEKSGEIASLKREIATSSAEVRNVKNIERQLGELREEKRHNMGRINNLETELRDMKLKRGEQDGFEVERLKIDLQNAETDKKVTEERLTKQLDSLRKLRNHAVEDFEAKLRDRAGQIASLETELLELREKVLDDDFDDIFLDEKPGQTKKQLVEERDMLLSKILALGTEIETLQAAAGTNQVSELKKKLVRSEQLREELEKDRSVLDSHQVSELKKKLAHSERLLEELDKDRSVFSSSKDKEIDRLHRQLSEAKEAQTVREQEQLSMLKKLENENGDIREEFTIRMKDKNAKIMALEQTLAAQEQVVGNMSSEMDQLQNGMEKVSVQRRAEIEEMSQELMDYTSKATGLEREVMALSMKLDDKKLKHKAEVAKLKERITTLESEPPLQRVGHHDTRLDDKKRENELTDKNDHLKWINKSLKDENEKLKGKVDLLKANNTKTKEEMNPTQKSAKNNDKWRNVALQEQVAVLSQRVIELEEAASSPTQGHPPQNPRPSILHSPVMRSSLERGSGSSRTRTSSTPKSALRVSTYDDANQANGDLLSNNDARAHVHDTRTPPSLPRGSNTPKSMSEKSKSSRSASSRFSLRKKGSSRGRSSASPKCDDASGSTANYDF